MCLDALLEAVPVPPWARGDIPHVKLHDALTSWGPREALIGTRSHGFLVGSKCSTIVDGLKDFPIDLLGLWRLKGETHFDKHVGKALHTNANRPVAHVGIASLRHGVVIYVNHTVQV